MENIDLVVSDDGSADSTLEKLEEHQASWQKGKVTILRGPCQGFAENYRHLIRSVDERYDLFAFSDQDDLWLFDKLSTAANWLSGLGNDIPGLHCSRTEIINEDCRTVGMSPLFDKPPGFRNAIVQSIAGGNTMVLNRAAFKILAESCRRTGFVSHDWWAYLLVSGAGGQVRYTAQPGVRYRQHGENLVGANSSWRARMHRLLMMAGGRFARWNARNIAALRACEDLLSADALSVLDEFEEIRSGPLLKRLLLLQRSGIHRQTFVGQLSLYAACFLRRT